MRTPLLLLWLLPLAALFLWGCGSAFERSLIYHPVRHLESDPRAYGLHYEDVTFQADDGVRLHGWLVPGRTPWTLLWAHGNAGNISHRLENIKEFHDRLGPTIFIFDYRGYGRSGGSPSEEGLYRDARAALATLEARADLDPERMIYFGRSLGAAVAVELALHRPPAGLILETPFLSVPAMANRTLPGLGYLFRTRYDSLAKIGRLQVPLLVLHGDQDEVVPFVHGWRLFETAPEPKTFYAIRGAHHNDTYIVGGEPYWRVWRSFLEGLRLGTSGRVKD